jgi:hypothetical protein
LPVRWTSRKTPRSLGSTQKAANSGDRNFCQSLRTGSANSFPFPNSCQCQ